MSQRWGSYRYSRAQCGDETEADPFTRAEVLVFKARKQPFPNVLDQREERGGRDKKRSWVETRKERLPETQSRGVGGWVWTDYGLKRVLQLISRRGRWHHVLWQHSTQNRKQNLIEILKEQCLVNVLDLYLSAISAICGRRSTLQMCVPHHGWSSLLHTAKDEGLAVFPDLIFSIPQPVHQSWQNYREQKSWVRCESTSDEVKDKWGYTQHTGVPQF